MCSIIFWLLIGAQEFYITDFFHYIAVDLENIIGIITDCFGETVVSPAVDYASQIHKPHLMKHGS